MEDLGSSFTSHIFFLNYYCVSLANERGSPYPHGSREENEYINIVTYILGRNRAEWSETLGDNP